jgi:hypothetical protein
MAIGISNYPNIHAPDSDYLEGDIKDDTGSDDGTPVNRLVYGDVHQTLAKIMRMPGAFSGQNIVPNGLRDNEYNGFQYVQALLELFGRNKRLFVKDGLPSTDVVESDYNTVVLSRESCPTGHNVSMAAPTGSNIGRIFVYNYSPHSLNIFTVGAENINGVAPPFVVPTQTAIEFTYTSVGPNWTITERYLLDN